MDKINKYTSTGRKLLHHSEMLHLMKNHHRARPLSFQIAPTNRCNLSCVFCSNVKRNKHEDISFPLLARTLEENIPSTHKPTVEWTGGGDPTMYHSINSAIEYVANLGWQQGLITNGVLLRERISQYLLDKLAWVRISMNCLDYVEDIDIPKIKGTLGFSYVINSKTNNLTLKRLKQYAEAYEPSYIRIVPNCQATDEEQIKNNEEYSKLVASWGSPFFYQPKVFEKPIQCWWGWLKPFLLHDGWVYPCSSIILNDEADKHFHEKYRWTKWEDLHKKYYEQMLPFSSEKCHHCVFKTQNDLIEGLINPNGMENFI